MRSELRRQIIVAAAAICVFFTALGKPYLWDEDEPKNAECTREMLEAGNWVVPQFNYQLRTDKPILLYWLMLTSYETFGVNEFAARFWSATLAVGTSLLTYHLARRLYGPSAGVWSGLAMASCLMFAVSGRAATPDSTLIFCTTLTFYCFARFGGVETGTLTRGGYIAMYAAMGLAVLAKGPVGVALPGGALGLFLFCNNLPKTWRTVPQRLWNAAWSLRPFTAVAVLAIVALPWYVLVGVRTDGAWLEGFLGKHNVARFTGAMEGHTGPIFYYIVAVLVGFFPWSCFLPPAIYCLGRRLRLRKEQTTRPADMFIACWAGAYLVFFSLARTKLPSYVLPCYPALAIATGAFLEEWLRQPATIARGWFRSALYVPALVGIALVVGLPLVASQLLPGDEWLGVFGIVPIVGSAALVWAERTGRNVLVPRVFAATSVVFIASLVGGAAVQVSERSTSPAIAAAVHNAVGDDVRLIGFRHFDPTLPFYLRGEVPLVDSPEQLRAARERWPNACIVTRDEHLADLAAALGSPPEIISRHHRFLRKSGELVVALPHDLNRTAAKSDRRTR